MKPSKRSARAPSRLSDSTHRQLNMYALAASAAGVGVLAVSQASEAKVVYTPANTQVDWNLQIDLNNDGVNDFTVQSWDQPFGSYPYAVLRVFPYHSGNDIVLRGRKIDHLASALKKGAAIDRKRDFNGYGLMLSYHLAHSKKYYGGYWIDVTNRYLGLKFQIKGKTHYGWARFNVTDHGMGIDAVLTGYAYETIPNKGIVAGKTKGPDVVAAQPGSLGSLALGRK